MYLFKVSLLSLIIFSLVGCVGKSYPPKEKKKSYMIEESRLPSSIQETTGRYRKEL
jgi:uncharacterized protein YcfL